ncbi:MAG TPA: argininosuccinate lyase [Candidatus Xenobia bacterium]|nr:argininosuccinate lyase [Candidatus Xenobia bacterium]
MTKMWSGRFAGSGLDPGFEQWQRSFPFDQRLLPQELAASRAYAEALAKAGALTAEECRKILDGLAQVEKKVAAEPVLLESSDAEDVHHFVEQQLVALVGDVGSKLHTGRSRNEQIATDLRLFVRARCDAIGGQLAELIGVFVERAKTLGETAMPAYTHLQRAEPVLAAHWLLAYAEMFFRDAERLAECRRRVNTLPLGSGAVAGAWVKLDREAMAQALGFERLSANSVDATSDRDFALEFLHALSFLALHLSRWAEEMTLFSTAEFGFVELPEAFATGSSAMPQKKNPDALELLRGKTGRVAGAAVALFTMLKGLPLAYNKDMQESQEPLFDAADTVSSALGIAGGLLRAVSFDTERMGQAARAPFLNATAAANYLARRGVPFRQAHAAIGQAVRYCLEKNKRLETLSLDELRQFSPAFADDFPHALELSAALAEHDVVGGTAPARVRQALAEAEQRLKAVKEALRAHA